MTGSLVTGPEPIPASSAAVAALRATGTHSVVHTTGSPLMAMAHDASHYLLYPQAVVRAHDAAHVAEISQVAATHGLGVTFRSGGTSLSGQASTQGLLVDTRRQFRRVEVLDDGARVRAEPGATLRVVNAHLARHGVALGPDPASEAACTVGGIIANNSSGMACGTRHNAYRTVESMTIVLASGTILDTGAADADAHLRAHEPALWAGLAGLRQRIHADRRSLERIRHQFAMKNTMGYSLNAFVDYERPVDILAHLLIGSEGTLGFVSSVTLRTVPRPQHLATALLICPSLGEATAALAGLVGAGARTVELMDPGALRVMQRRAQTDTGLAGLSIDQHTGLLVEVGAPDPDEFAPQVDAMRGVVEGLSLAAPARFTLDTDERTALWQLRKGLYAAVAGARPSGTTALLEDVAVPLGAMPAVTEALQELFARHGYADDAVIFGHAKDGNLHFMITPRFDEPSARRRYESFTEDLVDLILAADGSLKAEHGTGRVMAPYVQRQFGDELYAVMQAVKGLCDPPRVLNPGVVLTDDPHAHLAHLKMPVAVDPAVDSCVECGYCEPVCPSSDATTSPRQRIVLMRETRRAASAGDLAQVALLRRQFGYGAVDTCAADSMCRTACPVGIDTGAVMRGERARRHGPLVQHAARLVAGGWAPTLAALRTGLHTAAALPPSVPSGASTVARRVLSHDWIPLLGEDLPDAGPSRPAPARPPDAAAVFFPACIDSLFGPRTAAGDAPALGATGAFGVLCERAGIPLVIPEGINGLCCATPWKSKGLDAGYEVMARRTVAALRAASDDGRLPVVCESSSCALGLTEMAGRLDGGHPPGDRSLRILDAVSFVRGRVLPRLTVRRRVDTVALHPTCSGEHLGSTGDLEALAAACAGRVVIPASWGCCGFAGDRGLLHPEVTAAATRRQAGEVSQLAREATRSGQPVIAFVSANRPCEVAMSRATGQGYRHILELVEACTRDTAGAGPPIQLAGPGAPPE